MEYNYYSKRGEAVINNSLLVARRSSEDEARGGTRSCRQGFFAYFLFRKKVGEKAVLFFLPKYIVINHLILY
jgi:hypothetical protein